MKKLLSTLPVLIAIALCVNGFRNTTAKSKVQTNNLPTCEVKPKSIYDGDTLRLICSNQEIKVRFACIDAPELKMLNGIASRDHLRSLLANSGNQVKVNAITTDRYKRTIAELYTPSGELVQLQQVQDGMVWGYEKYKSDCPTAVCNLV